MVTSLVQSAPIDDDRLVSLWLRNRKEHTKRAYAFDVGEFRSYVDKPLASVTVMDLQDYHAALVERDYSQSTIHRRLSSVKSLFSYLSKARLLDWNVAAILKAPQTTDALNERILTPEEIQRMLALERDRRNHLILRLLYGSGVRCSELTGLQWRHVVQRSEAGQITVHGKGDKDRSILLSRGTWEELQALGPGEGYVFKSKRSGKKLNESQVWRIVRAAAERAGIARGVSPHWLRHTHATEALERGAPIHLVMRTLGHANLSVTGKYTHARPGDSSARYLPV